MDDTKKTMSFKELEEHLKNKGFKPIEECKGMSEEEKVQDFLKQAVGDSKYEELEELTAKFFTDMSSKFTRDVGISILCILVMKTTKNIIGIIEEGIVTKDKDDNDIDPIKIKTMVDMMASMSIANAIEMGLKAILKDRAFERQPVKGEAN